MGFWVGGERVKDALLSFLLSQWPLNGITHLRKETLLPKAKLRESANQMKSLHIVCVPVHENNIPRIVRSILPFKLLSFGPSQKGCCKKNQGALERWKNKCRDKVICSCSKNPPFHSEMLAKWELKHNTHASCVILMLPLILMLYLTSS